MHQIFQQSILLKYRVFLLFFWSGDMNISASCRQPQSGLYTIEIPHMASNCFLRYCLQWCCNFSDLFYLLYFLSSQFVSILQSFTSLLLQVTVPFLFEFRSFASCVCPFSSCHILTSAVSYVRNTLFQVLELFCMVINYRMKMWSSANWRGKMERIRLNFSKWLCSYRGAEWWIWYAWFRVLIRQQFSSSWTIIYVCYAEGYRIILFDFVRCVYFMIWEYSVLPLGRLVGCVVQTSYMELIRSWEIYSCSASQEMEAEASLQYSQQATASPYPAPDASVGVED